ncbi:MAG TPA: hypothetical protein VF865_09050 [Acidobacteriaceae bacterium]
MNAQSHEAESAEMPEPRRVLRRYLLWLLAVPVFVYCFGFALVRMPGFERWGGSLYGPSLDFGFGASGVNADVVIFGDSSALYDLRPLEMSAALGVKTINLPNTAGSLAVTDDMALRDYLGRNTPPRLIVFYFSAWNLDYLRYEDMHLIYEGEEMLARHGSFSEILSFAKRHPDGPLLFPLEMYSVTPKAGVMAAVRRQDRVSAIAASMGHMDAASRGQHLDSSCVISSNLAGRLNMDSARSLALRYRSAQTAVLIFIAPVPECRNASQVAGRSYAAISAAPPKLMQASSFWDDGFYTHLDPSAISEATADLVEAVRPALDGGSGGSKP